MAIRLRIYKVGTTANYEFKHVQTDAGAKPFYLGGFYAKTDGDYFKITESGGSRRFINDPTNIGIKYDEIEFIDETDASAVEVFADIESLVLRLKQVAYPGFKQPEATGTTSTFLDDGTNTTVSGSGTEADPYKVNVPSLGGAVSSVNTLTGDVVVNGANINVTNPVTSTQTALDTALADIEAANSPQDIDSVLGVGDTGTGKNLILVGDVGNPEPIIKTQTSDESDLAALSPFSLVMNSIDGFETLIAKDKVRLSKDGLGIDIKSDLQLDDAVWTIPAESTAEIFASQGWTMEQIALIEAGNCLINAGDNVTVTGDGSALDPYIIGSTTWDGVNINVLDPTDSVERALNTALDNILTAAEAIPEINVLFLQNSAYGVKLYTNTSGFQTTLPLVDEGGSNAAGLMPYSDHTAIAANTAALALREQYFYRNPVASSAVTGVTTQTYLSFAKIDANALQNGSEFSIDFLVNKTGTAGTFVLKIWKNTTNSLSGATQIAEVTGLAATGWGMFHREIIVDGSNIIHFTTATGTINDSSTILANVATSSAFDVAVDNYFIISVTPTSSADSFICRKATIKGIR